MALADLNIDVANFGDDDNYMFLYDPGVFLDFHDGSGFLGLGYMEAEKTLRMIMEYAMFKTGIPKTEIRRDMLDQEISIEGIVKQLQPETIAFISQRRYDATDPTWRRVHYGTQVPVPVFPSCVLVGQTVDGNEIRFYIRRLQIATEDLEIVLGGDEYASVPFKGLAQKDATPLVTNPTWPHNEAYADQDNIAFFAWPKTGTSSGDLTF